MSVYRQGTRERRAGREHDGGGRICTRCAARGEDVLRVIARTGHEDIETTEGHVALGGLLSTSIGEVFPPSPLEALGLRVEAPRLRAPDGPEAAAVKEVAATEEAAPAAIVVRPAAAPIITVSKPRTARGGSSAMVSISAIARARGRHRRLARVGAEDRKCLCEERDLNPHENVDISHTYEGVAEVSELNDSATSPDASTKHTNERPSGPPNDAPRTSGPVEVAKLGRLAGELLAKASTGDAEGARRAWQAIGRLLPVSGVTSPST